MHRRPIEKKRSPAPRLQVCLLLLLCFAPHAAADETPPGSKSPPQSNVEPIDVTREDFAVRVSNSWCMSETSGNAISGQFLPNLAGFADLNAFASVGGFDHFNIEQDIVDISGVAFPGLFPRWTGVDPLPGGNTFYQFDDQYPWYYDEVPTPGGWMPTFDSPNVLISGSLGEPIGLRWADAPHIGPGNAGVTITFMDYLVGVRADHSGVRISEAFPEAQNVNFEWAFVQGQWGTNAPEGVRFAGFDKPEAGAEAAINFLGYFGSDPDQLTVPHATNCSP